MLGLLVRVDLADIVMAIVANVTNDLLVVFFIVVLIVVTVTNVVCFFRRRTSFFRLQVLVVILWTGQSSFISLAIEHANALFLGSCIYYSDGLDGAFLHVRNSEGTSVVLYLIALRNLLLFILFLFILRVAWLNN